MIFRLNQSEYERLRLACAAVGARSISDYTRSGVLNSIETDSQGLTISERFQAIDQRLGELERMIRIVYKRMTVNAPRV